MLSSEDSVNNLLLNHTLILYFSMLRLQTTYPAAIYLGFLSAWNSIYYLAAVTLCIR